MESRFKFPTKRDFCEIFYVVPCDCEIFYVVPCDCEIFYVVPCDKNAGKDYNDDAVVMILLKIMLLMVNRKKHMERVKSCSTLLRG